MTQTQELSKEEEIYKEKFLDLLYYVALQNKGEADLTTSFLVAQFTEENKKEIIEFSGVDQDQTNFANLTATIFAIVERELPSARTNLQDNIVKCINCIDTLAETEYITPEHFGHCNCE